MKVKDLFQHMFSEGITEETFNMKVPSLNLSVDFELKILKVESDGEVVHETHRLSLYLVEQKDVKETNKLDSIRLEDVKEHWPYSPDEEQ